MRALILSRFASGGEQGERADLSEALTRAWPFDAHITQYEADRRLTKKMVADGQPMVMRLAMFDFDCPNHEALENHPEFLLALEKLPPGWQAYATAGGFRAYTEIDFQIDDVQDWEEWRSIHEGLGRGLSEVLGVVHDPACSDPSRLFRLPNVRREGKPCYPELYGALGEGTGEFAWAPAELRPATEVSEGSARDTLLGEAFAQLGHVQSSDGEKLTVRCPWAHEHSDPAQDAAVVYATEDSLGKFHCGHTHCKGRGTAEVLDALRGLPATSRLLDSWGLGQEDDPEPEPVLEAAGGPSGGPFLRGADLAAALAPVNWLVEGLEICPGRPPMLVADSGVGKSWALQSLALSVAAGLPVFSRFSVRQGPVLHISQDSGMNATRRRYQRLALGMGLDLRELPIAVYNQRMRLVDARGNFSLQGFKPINDEVIRGGYALVILDSLATICAGLDENGVEIAQPLWSTIDPDVVWMWAHHTPKSGGVPRGSSALRAASGVVWRMSKTDDGLRAWELDKSSEETDGRMPENFKTQWIVNGDAARIIVHDPNAQVQRQEERPADRIAREILRVMADGRSTRIGILEVVGGNDRLKRAVFGFLVYSRVIEHVGQRYTLAAGVTVPRVPDEIVAGAYKIGNKSRT